MKNNSFVKIKKLLTPIRKDSQCCDTPNKRYDVSGIFQTFDQKPTAFLRASLWNFGVYLYFLMPTNHLAIFRSRMSWFLCSHFSSQEFFIKLVNPRGIAKFTQESEFIYCALISEGPGFFE